MKSEETDMSATLQEGTNVKTQDIVNWFRQLDVAMAKYYSDNDDPTALSLN
jgi:hypothetical protein